MIGPTGKFPKGKLNQNDEGELAMAIAADTEKKVVMINFGKPLVWMALPLEEAKEFILILQKKIEELQGSI